MPEIVEHKPRFGYRLFYYSIGSPSLLTAIMPIVVLLQAFINGNQDDLQPNDIIPAILLVGAMGTSAIIMFYVGRSTRIITSPEGIEYREWFVSITTPWMNVMRVGKGPFGSLFIYLYQPEVQEGPFMVVDKDGQPPMASQIPLTAFISNVSSFRETKLGSEITKYAPEVLERHSNLLNYFPGPDEHQKQQIQQSRTFLVIAGVVLLLFTILPLIIFALTQ